MPEFRTIAIVGLGLIGGSLARDLAARKIAVMGYDADPATIRGALDAGIVTTALGPDLAGIEAADVLVIAVPVTRAVALLEAVAPRVRELRLVTDVGGTKERIAATAERLGLAANFVGGHPLAGDHRAGWTASRTGLFQGARVFLSTTPGTGPAALACARGLWTAVGARTEEVSATAHDRNMAWISHLPQVASTALAAVLAAEGIGPDDLGPGGRDLTRLAASLPALWSEIARENAPALSAAVRSLEERLREFRQALEAEDGDLVHQIFAVGSDWAQPRVVEGSG